MYKEYYGLKGVLTSSIDSDTLLIPVSANISGALIASGFNNGQDVTYLAIYSGGFYEIVQVTEVFETILTVVRGYDPGDGSGTGSYPFAAGSTVEFVVTTYGIISKLPDLSVTILGGGVLEVENPVANQWNLYVPELNLSGSERISILGSFPDYTIVYTPPDNPCCDNDGGEGGSGTGIQSLQGVGVINAYVSGDTGYVELPDMQWTSSPNVTITGSYPNFDIQVETTAGVASVGVSTGLFLTGSPTVNPVIGISATGVVPGNYGGVQINAQGQFLAVPIGFNPVSEIADGGGVSLNRVGGTVTIGVDTAAIGVPGIAPLADPTDDFDPDDATSIATPAVVAKALETLVSTNATGASNYTSEIVGDYTNILAGTTTSLELTATEMAIIYAEVTMVDGTAPLTPVAFGLAVFNGLGALIKGNRKVTQSQQSMSFILSGPFSGSVGMATTAPAAGATVQSFSFIVTKL